MYGAATTLQSTLTFPGTIPAAAASSLSERLAAMWHT